MSCHSAALARQQAKLSGERKSKKPVQKTRPQSRRSLRRAGQASEVELCTDPDATLERHLEDTESFAAFETVVDKQEPLVERRSNSRLSDATPRSVMRWRRLRGCRGRGDADGGRVGEAVMRSRGRRSRPRRLSRSPFPRPCVLQRSAHWSSSASPSSRLPAHQRSLGKADDELAAEKAASNFQVAAASASAAAAAAAALLAREEKDDSKQLDVADPADAATPDEVTPMGLKPEEAAAISNASLQEF